MCAGFFTYIILTGFYQAWETAEMFVDTLKKEGVKIADFMGDMGEIPSNVDPNDANPLFEQIELPETFKMIETVKHVMFTLVVLGTIDYLI